jgi:uncharacterized protein (DUF736 family)
MAITLGSFTQQDTGSFTGTLKTLNFTATLTIVPIDKASENAPDYRIYAGQRYEVGAAWSQIAKSSGETYLNLKVGAPDYAESLVMRSAGCRRPGIWRFLGRSALHNDGLAATPRFLRDAAAVGSA